VFAYWVLTQPPGEWGVIAPTRSQAIAICVESKESGLLKALGPALDNWNRSEGKIWTKNGAEIHVEGSDYGGARIEGKNLRGGWADEIGKWKKPVEAWKEALWYAVRMGERRIIATGTPKGRQGIVKWLLEEPEDVVMTLLSVEENRANLSPGFYEENVAKHGGTRLGRQEIYGEILDDVAGALWTWAMIEANRRSDSRETILGTIAARCVVAVDPAISSEEDSDETGIVAAASVPGDCDMLKDLSEDARRVPHGFVLADRSGRYSPMGWAEAAVGLYRELGADRIVAEKNQGGEMVRSTLHAVDPNVPITLVHAAKGKRTRAEPISALYEQNRVHHVEAFPELESEQTSWVPGEDSPSRMDALVWALTDLFDNALPSYGIAESNGTPGPMDGIAEAVW